MRKNKPLNNFPLITFRDIDPLQDYYNDDGECYLVAKLVDEAKSLIPFEVPIASLDLGTEIWENISIYEAAFHCEKVKEADLSYPIILDWNGRIADGRHRIIKAIMEKRKTIKAVRITWKITPDKIVKNEN